MRAFAMPLLGKARILVEIERFLHVLCCFTLLKQLAESCLAQKCIPESVQRASEGTSQRVDAA